MRKQLGKTVKFLVLIAFIAQLGGCYSQPRREIHAVGKDGNVDVRW